MCQTYQQLCATKTSRLAAAEIVLSLAAECGAEVLENDPKAYGDPRLHRLLLGFGAHRVTVEFIGGERMLSTFLAHWHGPTPYPRGFAVSIRGSVNAFHGLKATTCEADFPGLLRSLRDGFQHLNNVASAQRAKA